MKRHKEIQKLAYEIFEKSGRVHGREFDHWLEAERIIKTRQIDVHAADIEAVVSKKRVVERSDTRRHEAKKIGKTKRSK
jgi:Protein of unknown function (DUF2934)